MSRSTGAVVLVALTGALSTEVVESGPFTSLEQAMLATDGTSRDLMHHFSVYNAVATAAGSLGALAAGAVGPLGDVWAGAPRDQAAFWLFVPIAIAGAGVASRLSSRAELPHIVTADAPPLSRSRPTVIRLSALFAADSFGGGFVVQAFLAYWLATRCDASQLTIGVVFFAFAPNLPIAIALLLARVVLSQMDVPARQAYVMALVDSEERTAAAAYANTARYVVLGGDRALARLASIVHAADIETELHADPAGPGLLAIGLGGLDVEADDHRLLERASFVYDALYACCGRDVTAAA